MWKDYIWNSTTCSCQNGRYSANIMDDLVITCDAIIAVKAKSNDEETKTFPTNVDEEYLTYKT